MPRAAADVHDPPWPAARERQRVGLHVGVLYWTGVAIVAALLGYEHTLVRPGDLRRLDAAFFTMNGVISIAFLGFVLADALVSPHDLRRLNAAFFTMNGVISIAFFVFVLAEALS